jgi:hypothetical protein
VKRRKGKKLCGRAFFLKVCRGNVNSMWPFPKERTHIDNLATSQDQEKCSKRSRALQRGNFLDASLEFLQFGAPKPTSMEVLERWTAEIWIT